MSFTKLGNYDMIKSFYLKSCFSIERFVELIDELKKPLHDAFIFMLCTRGCKFYPQVFDSEFQQIALTYLFVKGLP